MRYIKSRFCKGYKSQEVVGRLLEDSEYIYIYFQVLEVLGKAKKATERSKVTTKSFMSRHKVL